jgi:hypothetical protein
VNTWGGGFITIINYGTYGAAISEEFTITTENNVDLLTEDGKTLFVESE